MRSPIPTGSACMSRLTAGGAVGVVVDRGGSADGVPVVEPGLRPGEHAVRRTRGAGVLHAAYVPAFVRVADVGVVEPGVGSPAGTRPGRAPALPAGVWQCVGSGEG